MLCPAIGAFHLAIPVSYATVKFKLLATLGAFVFVDRHCLVAPFSVPDFRKELKHEMPHIQGHGTNAKEYNRDLFVRPDLLDYGTPTIKLQVSITLYR